MGDYSIHRVVHIEYRQGGGGGGGTISAGLFWYTVQVD